MNRIMNTIKHNVQKDTVYMTTLAFGSTGFTIGGFIGIGNGFYSALLDDLDNDTQCNPRSRLVQDVRTIAHVVGRPIIGAIGGTIIGVTAPVSVPILYCLYKISDKNIFDDTPTV